MLKIGTLHLAGLSGLRGREVNSFLLMIIFGVFVMHEWEVKMICLSGSDYY